MTYVATLLILFSVGVLLAVSLNLLLGFAGQLSMTHGALTGIGAYVFAIASVSVGVSPLLSIVLGAVLAALLSAAFAYGMVRLAEYDYVLVSLMIQMLVIVAIGHWSAAGGTSGFTGVRRPSLFGVGLAQPWAYAAFAGTFAIVGVFVARRLAKSPYALALRGFRESERSVAALGVNTTRLRVVVAAIAGLGAGLAGTIHAGFVGFLQPNQFSVHLSILVVVYVLVGGSGNILGSLAGVALVMAIPEVINASDLVPSGLKGPLEQITYGLVIMLFIWFRPQGIFPERPILRLGARRSGSGANTA